MNKLRIAAAMLILAALCYSGCARRAAYELPPVSEPPVMKGLAKVDPAGMDFADDLDADSLNLAVDRSLRYYQNGGRSQVFAVEGRLVDAAVMIDTLLALRGIISLALDPEERNRRIRENFEVYRAFGEKRDGAVLFTGYYEPLLEGSLVRTDKHRYPLYRTPPDLNAEQISPTETRISRLENGRKNPYYSRREIDIDGVLLGRGLEIAWVADPVELFSLHIQGSGKIRLPDGRTVSVSYAQNNGRPFRSVTRNMLDQNRIAQSDSGYRSFKTFLKSKSEQDLFEILSYNERYIFFRFVDSEPVGSLGQPVTPNRTIATDPDYFPQGAPAFIRMRKPVFDENGNIMSRVGFSRFVLNQDRGSAIKGPGRVDLFCGFGDQAQSTAGTIKEKGELYFLIKR